LKGEPNLKGADPPALFGFDRVSNVISELVIEGVSYLHCMGQLLSSIVKNCAQNDILIVH
jgi:hypothetical protein